MWSMKRLLFWGVWMLDLKWLVPCTFDHSKPDCMTRLVITTASWCLRAQRPFSWCSTQRDQNESLFCSNCCWIELERSPVGCGTWWHRDILLDQSRVWSQGLWESCCGPARWGKVLAAGCPIFQRLFQQPNAKISANFSQFQPIFQIQKWLSLRCTVGWQQLLGCLSFSTVQNRIKFVRGYLSVWSSLQATVTQMLKQL